MSRRRHRRHRIRSLFTSGRIGHVRPGIFYHVGNSWGGLRRMFRSGKRNADRDLSETKDHVAIVNHWPRPGVHDDFHDPAGKIPRNATIGSLTWAQVSRLRAGDGTRINRLETDMDELARLGITPWYEPKSGGIFRTQAFWDHLVAEAHKRGIKTVRGYTLRANADCLPYMHAAGIPAHRLRK